MNSTEGLSGDLCMEPNVEAVFGDSGAVEMSNSFLIFKAARDIVAFEELAWRYAWAKEDASAATTLKAEASQTPKSEPSQTHGAGAPLAEEAKCDAPDPEVLACSGREIARGTGCTVYLYKEHVIAHFEKPMKKMPAFSVGVFSARCRSTNAWRRVEYTISPKSKVQLNGDTTTVKALGASIDNVWGYEAPDCKKRRQSEDGEMKPLFWAPTKEDLAMCDALLDLGDCVQPVFTMEVQIIDDARTLVPKGVTFLVKSRSVQLELAASKTKTLVLAPGGGRGEEECDVDEGERRRGEKSARTKAEDGNISGPPPPPEHFAEC